MLILTADPILLLDLTQALAAGGFVAVTTLSPRLTYNAIVVDVDGLDRRRMAVVRRQRQAGRPVFAIADRADQAQGIAGDTAIWFQKPLCSTTLTERVKSATGQLRT